MVEYNIRAAQPSEAEVESLTNELVVRPHVTPDDGSVSRMVEWLRTERRKGGAELAGFHIAEHPVFDSFASRNALNSPGVIESVLAHESVRDSLPYFRIASPLKYRDFGRRLRGWSVVWPYRVAGDWATCLDSGGFDVFPDEVKGTGREARGAAAMDTAMSAYKALTGGRYRPGICAYQTSDAWCEWFPGVFNSTWIVYDSGFRLLWLLAITDMD
ncbi:hypothetical protein [Saccharopolyspora sp. ASAGF58]|uniref:hypothetical protein n=1 Tax=Saccharopolyspora sp. ASAGF58 TaxID=2719023 RepID=UPI001447C7F2|nr:hypothetical protein [Saccharopolyspora sp. ASAGF58]